MRHTSTEKSSVGSEELIDSLDEEPRHVLSFKRVKSRTLPGTYLLVLVTGGSLRPLLPGPRSGRDVGGLKPFVVTDRIEELQKIVFFPGSTVPKKGV